ncbi:hypothetical protein MIR68_006358 [Amoeboaphelidium protococcarum]|nr:hypothetical protein MIR68_006358 [Amoeboaphelidium protococcarum]
MADSDRLLDLTELKRQINTSVNAQRYWQLLHVFFNASIDKTEFDAQVKEILGSDDLITVHNKLMLYLIHTTLPDVGGGTQDADQQLLEWQQIVRGGGLKSDENVVIIIDPLSNAETLMYQTLLNFPTLDELRRSLDETIVQSLPAVDKKVQNTQALIKSGLLSDCEFLDLSVVEHRLASVSESEGVKFSDDCTRYLAEALKLYLLNLVDRLVDQKTIYRPVNLRLNPMSQVSTSQNRSSVMSQRQSQNMRLSNGNNMSLYQRCVLLTERLSQVPGFKESLVASLPQLDGGANGHDDNDKENMNDGGKRRSSLPMDPVSSLWTCFRHGEALCLLVNIMVPNAIPIVHPCRKVFETPKLGQTNVYNFLRACKDNLHIDSSRLFTTSDLYRDDTNAFVKVLDVVEIVAEMLTAQGLIDDKLQSPTTARTSQRLSSNAKDNRDKVVVELLDTEQNYVQDLEYLQLYMNTIKQSGLLTDEEVRKMFSNLDQLVDFQRTFLVVLEDTCLNGESNGQNVGTLFSDFENAFKVYGPYCSNHSNATQMVAEISDQLKPFENVMEPHHQLPSYLIKPIQRVCKYPLLLRELLRMSDDQPQTVKTQLNLGFEAASRVTRMINEIQRRNENEVKVKDLAFQVEDWRGHDLSTFGDLLLDEKLLMVRRDVEKPMHVHLFEKILVCLKEVPKKEKKTFSIPLSSRKSHDTSSVSVSQRRQSLVYQFKGKVSIASMEGIVASSRNSDYEIKVFYKDGNSGEMESFVLKFLHEEKFQKWRDEIERLMAISELSRRRRKS